VKTLYAVRTRTEKLFSKPVNVITRTYECARAHVVTWFLCASRFTSHRFDFKLVVVVVFPDEKRTNNNNTTRLVRRRRKIFLLFFLFVQSVLENLHSCIISSFPERLRPLLWRASGKKNHLKYSILLNRRPAPPIWWPFLLLLLFFYRFARRPYTSL